MKRLSGLILVFVLLFTGCAKVEPEKRAYPLVVGIDWVDDRYQVILGMAGLEGFTKQGDSQGKSSGSTLSLTGDTLEEIMQAYDQTQEYYLDQGHLQVVILGEKILENQDRYEAVLETLENDPQTGDGAAVFQSDEVAQVLELNAEYEESLGMYLTGIYENRPNREKKSRVTLGQLYRSRHEKKMPLRLPQIHREKNLPDISA